MNKKIVFFVGSMNWGGAEKVISILANHYAEQGWDTTIVMLLSGNVVYKLDSRISLVSFSRENRSRMSNVFYWIKSIKKLIKNKKPDVIVSFVCRINILVLIAKIFSKHRCRVIVSERNDPRFDGRGKLASFMAEKLYPKADIIICQSSREKDFFSKKVQKNAVIVKNPVCLQIEPTIFSKKKHIIINAARFEKSKNQKMLIDAFAQVVKEGEQQDFILEIYGSGSLKDFLRKYVLNLHMDKAIFIKDSILNIQQEISNASIFCLSSNYEGMSNSLMEALLLGTPSISTNVSGSDDLIVNEKNGFIIDVGATNQLKARIIDLIRSEQLRLDMHNYCLSADYRKMFTNSIAEYKKYIEGDSGNVSFEG